MHPLYWIAPDQERLTTTDPCSPILASYLKHPSINANLVSLQNSKKSARNGRRRRRRRKPHGRQTRRGIALTFSSASMKVVLLAMHPMDRCGRQWVFPGNPPNTLNFHPSGTNLRLRAIPLPLSTALKVQAFLTAWLSTISPPVLLFTVQILTVAATLNRRMGKTRKCTIKAIRRTME